MQTLTQGHKDSQTVRQTALNGYGSRIKKATTKG